MKSLRLLATLLLVTAAVSTPGVAAANEPPLADAGLDQTVDRGTTVYLDAGGSRDPDGTIANYRWSVTAPNGTTTTPACPTCEQTRFRPAATGTYHVTLTVTDDDGASANDTLYVTVNPGEPPSVSLAGPNQLSTGDAGSFTADAAAGAASLDRVVWYVDGHRRESSGIDGQAATASHELRFPDAGTHRVTAVAVDADGQRANATRTVSVSDASTSSDDEQPRDTGDATSPADADVRGPRVVTEADSLTGAYELTDGASGTWVLDGRDVGTGSQNSLALSPGVHKLYATPDTGGVATFADGTRTVVADPAPDVTLSSVTNGSVVTVDAYATDGFENLRSISVLVDGEEVHTTTSGDSNGLDSRTVPQLTVLQRLGSIEPGTHTLTVRARDARGQVDTVTRTVRVPGPPRVISAGYVNDEPLDVYHPRIDSERYTGVYRVKVDLNGVEPENVGVDIRDIESRNIAGEWPKEEVTKINSTLIVNRSIAVKEPQVVESQYVLSWDRGSSSTDLSYARDRITVSPSPPEARVELVSSKNNRNGRRGLWFNASRSFDPDGTKLEYDWIGTNIETQNGRVVKLDSYQYAELILTDQQSQKTTFNDFLAWFVPRLSDETPCEKGPHFPDETVRCQASTVQYEIPKQTYLEDISYGLRVEQGSIINMSEYTSEISGGESDDVENVGTPSFVQHEWDISVPAKAFLDDSPRVTVFAKNTQHVERTTSLEKPSVYIPLSTTIKDTSVNMTYYVEKPTYEYRDAVTATERESLQELGYRVYSSPRTGTEYQLEQRIKTQKAEYATETEFFQTSGRRSYFLEMNPSWQSAGSESTTRRWTTTERVWRDSKSGDGWFTGDTREVRIQPPRYRTENQYRYETQERYQTTVWRTVRVEETVTETVEKENCTPFGCREYTTTRTYTETTWETRPETVTRYRTVEHTYWSTVPWSSTHEATGETRQVKIGDAVYETQYEFQVEQRHEETETTYFAEKRKLIEPAQYEWQNYRALRHKQAALLQSSVDGVRIGETVPTEMWKLRRQTGKTQTYVDGVEDEHQVLQTEIKGTVQILTKLRDPTNTRSGIVFERSEVLNEQVVLEGFISDKKAKGIIKTEVNKTEL